MSKDTVRHGKTRCDNKTRQDEETRQNKVARQDKTNYEILL